MKKYFSTIDFKKYNLKRIRKSVVINRMFKNYTKVKNRNKHFYNKDDNKYLRDKRKLKKANFNSVAAPENFSFIDNPDGIIDFISELSEHYDKSNPIFVNLENVKYISYDSIVILLSIMVKFKSKKIIFNGNFPKDNKARQVIEESKFFNYLYKKFEVKDRYELLNSNSNSILTHANKIVDSELTSKIIENASMTIWNGRYRCPGIQRTLIELMLNTNNHADKIEKGVKHWWLSVHHDSFNKIVRFAFIDFGIGIFESLATKTPDNKFYGILDRLKALFKSNDNANILRLILKGELHKTASGKYNRGKGLSGIYLALERNQISNLNFITNDVYANVQNQEYRILKKSFSGTFVYWEVLETNHSVNND